MAKYSKAVQKYVEGATKKMEKGTLRSGGTGKKVTNKKEVIAIGVSKAKKKGIKVPIKPLAAKKTVVNKGVVSKKASAKKISLKKATTKKLATDKKTLKKAPSSAKKDIVVGNAQKNPSFPQKVSAKRKIIDNDTEVIEESEDKRRGSEPSPKERADKNEDQKVYNKATSRIDVNHNMAISSIAKGGRKPTGKKPLW